MPIVTLNKSKFYKNLGKSFTDDEFADLCFEFGIELDDITSEKMIEAKEKGEKYDLSQENPEFVLYKIDVPANRYDLLCMEGIVRSLRIFLGLEKLSQFKLTSPSKMITINSGKEVKELRPFVVCAILRDLKFDEERYKSFIDLQEKLHKNICRERKLVSIGTHDLDSLSPPFSYHLLQPKEIVFTPLQKNSIIEWSKTNNKNSMDKIDAETLFEILKNDDQLKKYLKLIDKHEKWPVILDSKKTVLSLPPILNGEHSKIKLTTQNVFIEVTGTDFTKSNIVLNTIISMFSSYCSSPFTIEPVKVIDYSGKEIITPNISTYEIKASKEYVEKGIGVKLEDNKIIELLNKMSLEAEIEKDEIKVKVPITRSDVMQQCDIWEDVAIAFGFNKLPIKIPGTKCIGKQDSLNQLSDLIRNQISQSGGYIELLTEILISIKDNYENVKMKYNKEECVLLERSTTKMKDSFEIARTHLIPCLLKTCRSNQSAALPLKLFEVADIVVKDSTKDTGTKNERHLGVLYCGKNAGFEIVHGLLDRILFLLQISHSSSTSSSSSQPSYKLVKSNDPMFFTGANVEMEGKVIGKIGVIHPDVLTNFDLKNPCTVFELNIEHFL